MIKFTKIIINNLVTPKGAAKLELLFNEPTSVDCDREYCSYLGCLGYLGYLCCLCCFCSLCYLRCLGCLGQLAWHNTGRNDPICALLLKVAKGKVVSLMFFGGRKWANSGFSLDCDCKDRIQPKWSLPYDTKNKVWRIIKTNISSKNIFVNIISAS